MAEVYVLASLCDQGKSTTACVLEQYFKKLGKRVACIQSIKGQYDVAYYLEHGCNHYSLPLEASKDQNSLAQWMPKGFDCYIIEISMAFIAPIGAAFLDLFRNYHEVVSFDLKDNWDNYVRNYLKDQVGVLEKQAFFAAARKKKVQRVITKVPQPLDELSVDTNFVLHHPEKLVPDCIEPRMTLPHSNKKVIAVGAFPGEYRMIFPDLMWYLYDYSRFVKRLREGLFDIAIIGECLNRDLKIPNKPDKVTTICYQPSVYLDDCSAITSLKRGWDDMAVYRTIKEKPIGTPLADKELLYSTYNNRFWVNQKYSGTDIVHRKDNIMYCNGWILPQYLIKEGLLEV